MHRHGLLVIAVATVAVPGLLAMLAVRGHDHVAAEAGVTAAPSDDTALTGPFPVAPPTARASVRNDIAAVQRASGAPVTVLSRVTTGQQAMGMLLLDRAADADLATSYQGTERISQSGLDGSVTMISQVWHRSGGLTLVQTSNATTPAATTAAGTAPAASSVVDKGSSEGVFGVTRSLVALLGKHYVAIYQGDGSAVGRPAAIVGLYRFDGSLAARYWLDRQTMVPLRRELFDTSDNVISEDSFVQVQFGTPAGGQLAAPAALPAWVAESSAAQSSAAQPAQPAWVAAVPPARFLASLVDQGWRVPGALPGGLPLYAAAWTTTTDGEIADLEYSDGLYVVSLFVQRGTLAPDMPGWREVSVGGQQAYVSGHSVTWAGLGFVYTMIADAPPQLVTQVVGALQGSAPPGLLGRLGRGFDRLARLINPFA
jgi:sigma-E factor negative regulatory protein RseB